MSISSSRPCQANNPLTCPYHGDKKRILTSSQAEKNYQEALHKLVIAESPEALFQAYDDAGQANAELEVTPEGLRKLAEEHAAALPDEKYDLQQKHRYLVRKRERLLKTYKASMCEAENLNPYEHIVILDDEEAEILTFEDAYNKNIILKEGEAVAVGDEIPGYGKVISSYIEMEDNEGDQISNYIEFGSGLTLELRDTSSGFHLYNATPVRISDAQKIEYDHLRSYNEGMIIVNRKSGKPFRITKKNVDPQRPYKIGLYVVSVMMPERQKYVALNQNPEDTYDIAGIVS